MINKIVKMLAIMMLLLLAFSGCAKQGEPSASSEAPPPTEAELLQQKIDENFKIQAGDFKLVQFEELVAGDSIAVVETSMGTIKIRLFPDEASNTVDAFTELAKAGAYDDKLLDEVAANYLIRSGATTGNAVFENEYSLNLWHFRGAVGMVSEATGSSTGGQFYIIQNNGVMADVLKEMKTAGFPSGVWEKYNRHGGAPWMDGKSTVFGQVIEGMTVADEIVLAYTEAADAASQASSTTSVPVPDIKIVKVTIESYLAPSSK